MGFQSRFKENVKEPALRGLQLLSGEDGEEQVSRRAEFSLSLSTAGKCIQIQEGKESDNHS